MSIRIGVLALQGDVREHVSALQSCGADTVAVRRPSELAKLDGLVIPGGESTTMYKLAHIFDMWEPLQDLIRSGLPVYGSCAGMIMLADRLIEAGDQPTLGGLDVSVRRNAFGRQVDSAEEWLTAPAFGTDPLHAVFIRAPRVEQVGTGVSVLATRADGAIVAVQQGKLLATSFHPEVTNDARVHAYFVDMCR
ncbi:MAG: pyridoxal 5'-phosphate synthase glutaminase subunit PdxT [Propionibacteriaceae bacterium]